MQASNINQETNPLQHGLREELYENGTIHCRYNYENGLQHGLCEDFYENGSIKHRTNWKNGLQHGLEETFHCDGTIEEKCNYENGLQHGLHEYFGEDATIMIKVNYENGLQHGLTEHFYEDGIIQKRYNYENDKKHGFCEYFYTINTKKSEKYVHGILQENSQKYYIQDQEVTTCRICLDTFDDPQILDPCGHIFCELCRWKAEEIQEINRCPCCRQEYLYVQQ